MTPNQINLVLGLLSVLVVIILVVLVLLYQKLNSLNGTFEKAHGLLDGLINKLFPNLKS
jgi:hypothetical protein